jgi:hypothetical protein
MKILCLIDEVNFRKCMSHLETELVHSFDDSYHRSSLLFQFEIWYSLWDMLNENNSVNFGENHFILKYLKIIFNRYKSFWFEQLVDI